MNSSNYIEVINSMESLIEDMEYDIDYFNTSRYSHNKKENLIILKESLAKLISIKRLTLEYLENEGKI